MLGMVIYEEAHFNRRKVAVLGVLLLLIIIQGNLLFLNPVTLVQGNTHEDSSLSNIYSMKKSSDDDSWSSRTPMPTPRADLAAVTVNGKIYVVGGYNGTHNLATMEEYDPETDTWTPRASMPTVRGWLTATVLDGKIYVLGGSNGTNYLTTMEVYDPKTDTWTSQTPMPTPRYGLAAVTVGELIYAIGGQNDIGPGYQAIVEEYNPYTDTWRLRASMSTRRYGLAAVRCKRISTPWVA